MKARVGLIVAVGLLLAAGGRDEAAKADQDKLQGDWQMVSLTVAGEEVPAEKVKEIRLTIKGDAYQVKIGDNVIDLKVKLDPAKKPKAIDLTYESGDNKGKVNHAIYEIEGDTFKMCRHQQPDKDRPTEFASKEGTPLVLAVWKRVKP